MKYNTGDKVVKIIKGKCVDFGWIDSTTQKTISVCWNNQWMEIDTLPLNQKTYNMIQIYEAKNPNHKIIPEDAQVTKKMIKAGQDIISAMTLHNYHAVQTSSKSFLRKYKGKNKDLITKYAKGELDYIAVIFLAMDRERLSFPYS